MIKENLNPWFGVGSAVVGGVLGHLLFLVLIRQGFYALILPGFMTGLGYSLLIKHGHLPSRLVCGGLALVAGLYSEWRAAPFLVDPSLGYFLTHLHNLRGFTLFLIVVGAALALWTTRGRVVSRNKQTPKA